MAEPSYGNSTPERYEDTNDAKNPPNSVLQPQVRRTARWSFLIPIIILAILAGGLWMYWKGQPAQPREAQRSQDVNTSVGTSGQGAEGERSPGVSTPGGHNTLPSFGRTEDEIKFRGDPSKK
jgi:hypothetical protein